MEWFEALILGVLQGLTEYLPVSSSGHLAIGSALFGISTTQVKPPASAALVPVFKSSL